MGRHIALLSILIGVGMLPVCAQQFQVGQHVHSTVTGFDGTIVETGGTDGYVKVVLDGQPPEHASWLNPKWLKAGGGPQQTAQNGGGAQGGPWWNPGAGDHQFNIGDRVFSEVSKLYGTVIGGPDTSGYVKVRIDGSTGESALNPKWLKPAGGTPPTQMGGAPPRNAPTQHDGQTGQPPAGGAGPFPAGTKVEFDRAEGSQPQFGRWDTGTVIGHDQFGRTQIRSDTNGITYSITDNPKWIKPGGSVTPGPRHDYNDHPVVPPTTPNNPAQNAPKNGGGAAGPFSGEWTVISVDGQRYEPGAQNFNFVGSRYEILNQGMTMSGHFSVAGNSVKMISDDGSPFATFQYSMQGGQMVLSAPGTQYILIPAHK